MDKKEAIMKKSRKKLTIIFGVICTLFIAVSSWYTITYNESRILKPMNWSDYVFRTQDLPMISSVILFILYLLYLVMPMRTAILPDRRREAASQSARTVNPKLGLLGLSGFAGFLGFWTYRMDKSIFFFVFFIIIIDEFRRDFRIRLRVKVITAAQKFLFEFGVVFYYPVMHNRKFARTVRVSVCIVGLAVGCPAGVTDTKAAPYYTAIKLFFKIPDFALFLYYTELIFIQNSNTAAVISSVF